MKSTTRGRGVRLEVRRCGLAALIYDERQVLPIKATKFLPVLTK
jgi:hypothetical protein